MSGRLRICPAGRKIQIRFVARRFVCSAPLCRRRIFAERFDDGVVAERSRRTSRLECVVHHLGLALGGRPAASIAKRLMVPVRIRCCRWCGGEAACEPIFSALSALMTGPSAATIATALRRYRSAFRRPARRGSGCFSPCGRSTNNSEIGAFKKHWLGAQPFRRPSAQVPASRSGPSDPRQSSLTLRRAPRACKPCRDCRADRPWFPAP
jgi:hypothetical protein